MYALDKASDRISLEITGYTHEARTDFMLLTITSPKNHQNLENIRNQQNQLTDPQKSSALDTKNMPACILHRLQHFMAMKQVVSTRPFW
jgi:hypothetical protein